jgi:hypothetical protein
MSKVLFHGNHQIKLTEVERKKGCGILPIFGEVKIKTKGLKWDLDENI